MLTIYPGTAEVGRSLFRPGNGRDLPEYKLGVSFLFRSQEDPGNYSGRYLIHIQNLPLLTTVNAWDPAQRYHSRKVRPIFASQRVLQDTPVSQVSEVPTLHCFAQPV